MAPPTLTPADAVSYLVARNGNVKLAAIDASRALGRPITEPELLATLSSDPSAASQLATQARVLVTLRLLEMLGLVGSAFKQNYPQLSARDTAKTFASLSQALTGLAAPASAPADPFETVLREIARTNPEAADAIEALVRGQSQGQGAHHPQLAPATLVELPNTPPNFDPAAGSKRGVASGPTCV